MSRGTLVKVHQRFMIVGAFLGAAIAAGLAGKYVPNRYIAWATVNVALRVPGAHAAVLEHGAAEQLRIVAEQARNRLNLAPIVEGMYADERAVMPVEDVIQRMAYDIQISPADGAGEPPRRARISFVYREREQARVVVDRLVTRMRELNEKENGSRRAGWQLAPEYIMSVQSSPAVSGNQAWLVRAGYVGAGLVGGGLLGWLIALAIARPRQTVKAGAFAAVGCAAALMWSWALPDRYTSTGALAIAPELVPAENFTKFRDSLPQGSFEQIRAAVTGRNGMFVENASRGLYPDVEARESRQAESDKMREHISIAPARQKLGSGDKFNVSFTYRDAETASKVVRRLMAGFESLHLERSDPTRDGVREMLFLREAATMPEVPDGIGLGGAAAMGTSLGLLVWLLRVRRQEARGHQAEHLSSNGV